MNLNSRPATKSRRRGCRNITPTAEPGIRRSALVALALALALLPALAGASRAATLQTVGHFAQPIHVASDPSNPDRLLVAERGGRIVQIAGGAVSTLADLRPQVGCCEGGSGLLSIAPAPDFATSGRLYAFYTDEGAGNGEEGSIHIAEVRPGAALRDLVAPIPHPGASNHYGGQLQIGPDGALYASTGDGDADPDQAQTDSLLGKILRIDPRQPLPAAEVWAAGLRNPFRFSFDRPTNAILIGDVGAGAWEEVNEATGPGRNFGWPCFEGGQARSTSGPCEAPQPAFAAPLFSYPHDNLGFGERRGVIGGYVVRDPSLGGLYGRYLYGDLGSGEIRSLDRSNPFGSDRWEGLLVPGLHSFGEDACGRLYAVSGLGAVSRLVGAAPAQCRPPQITYAPERKHSFVRIRAANRKVKRRKRALISVWLSPCDQRRGDPVTLWHGRKRVGFRRLNRACSAHFRPRIVRKSGFRARIAGNDEYLPAVSRKVTIRPVRKLRLPRKPRFAERSAHWAR